MLEHGVRLLAIFDVDEEMGRQAIEHFDNLGVEDDVGLLFEQVDVTDEKAVDDAVNHIVGKWGRIDILLCFAGITESKLSVEYPIDSWRRIFDVNVHGTFLVARAVARYSLDPIAP